MSDEQVSGKDYAKPDKQTSVDAADIQQRLEHLEAGSLDIDSVISYLGHLLWNVRMVWESSDLQEKATSTEFLKRCPIAETSVGTLEHIPFTCR